MPFDRKRYPANWREIRESILQRAEHKCEWCGVPNHAYRVTWKDGSEKTYVGAQAFVHEEVDLMERQAKVSRIVLTIAHVHNPDPMDCRPENLAALCQRCHNRHDMPMRRANAKATLARKAGQASMEVTA